MGPRLSDQQDILESHRYLPSTPALVHRRWDFSTSDFGLNHLTYFVEHGRRNSVPVLNRDVRDIMSVNQPSLPHIARDECSSGRCCFFHMGPGTRGLWSKQPAVNPTTLQPLPFRSLSAKSADTRALRSVPSHTVSAGR